MRPTETSSKPTSGQLREPACGAGRSSTADELHAEPHAPAPSAELLVTRQQTESLQSSSTLGDKAEIPLTDLRNGGQHTYVSARRLFWVIRELQTVAKGESTHARHSDEDTVSKPVSA